LGSASIGLPTDAHNPKKLDSAVLGGGQAALSYCQFMLGVQFIAIVTDPNRQVIVRLFR
jgi:hypothetical protein